MTRRKRAYVETYGCQMNLSDGELMEGILEAEGYEIVPSPEDADVILVNTCAVREHAEQRVLGRVGQLRSFKRRDPEVVIGVTGCMAQRLGAALLERAPHVDLVMGPDGYRRLPVALRAVRGEATDVAGEGSPPGGGTPLIQLRPPGRGPGGRARATVLELDLEENYQGLEQRRRSRVSAWVPIQRGCDHRCTFCIVPYVRGPEKNRPAPDVLREVREVAESGITEVTLLGQTVNSYRWEEWDFPRLLRAVARTDGIRRVRFTSPHPNDVTPALVEVMAEEEAVCEHLHLPLQSGNDRILRRMLRRHTVEAFLEKVRLVREAVPEVALSTDVIVAFPGETEEEFQDTLAVLREVRFDEAFTYRYSPREGTPATRLPPEEFLPEEVGKARLDTLIEVTRRIQAEINEARVGRVEEVLVEREGKEPGYLLGRTRQNKVVIFPAEGAGPGQYRHVLLRSSTGPTFVGSLVGTPVGAGGP